MGGTGRHAAASAGQEAPALRAIIAYKSFKAVLELAAALLIALSWPLGLPEETARAAVWLHHHVAAGWASRLSNLLVAGTGRHLPLVIAGLGVDGVLTGFEAWALRSARWWGPWVVVAATALLLPFEVHELVRVPRLSRAVILVLNLLLLAYLAHRAWAERGAR